MLVIQGTSHYHAAQFTLPKAIRPGREHHHSWVSRASGCLGSGLSSETTGDVVDDLVELYLAPRYYYSTLCRDLGGTLFGRQCG